MASTEGTEQLLVDVIRASGVAACDPNGKSDPYCIVYVVSGDQSRKTEIKPATLNPVWNETFALRSKTLAPFVSPCGFGGEVQLSGCLVVDMWDHDTVNQDDFLGRVIIPLRELVPGTRTDRWYPLTRHSAKDNVTGSLYLGLELSLAEGKTLIHDKMDNALCSVCTARGYQLPVCSGKDILVFPGQTEHIEMAFSHVFVEVSSYHCIAHVYLTNYRLLILSTTTKASARSLGHGSALDLSMWIALNNIISVETASEPNAIRRQQNMYKSTAQATSITINCYDFRTVKLVFILSGTDAESPSTASSTSEHDRNLGQRIFRLGSAGQGKHPLKYASEIVQTTLLGFGGGGGGSGSDLPQRTSSDSVARPGKEQSGAKSGVTSWDRRYTSPAMNGVGARPRSGAVSRVITEEEPLIEVDESSDNSDLEDYIELHFPDNYLIDSVNDRGFSLSTSEDESSGSGQASIVLSPPVATSSLVQSFYFRLEHIILNIPDYPPALIFTQEFKGNLELLMGWDTYNFPKEMDRQGVPEGKWQLTVANGPEYKLCSTYPQLLYVPKGTENEQLTEVAKFRSKNRLPCLVWVDSKTHNFMMRCAQPFIGTAGKHSSADERLIQSALDSGPAHSHMTIFDARSFTAATGNRIMGKGTEDVSHYPNTKLIHLDIPNIHAVRDSYDSLRSVCLSTVSAKWHSALESTQWINYLSLILKGGTMIARYMKHRGGNALVHCSDGWDRTAQLTSLSQLMMDPYYRTVEGFKVLVDKEWLSFGHKFQHRLGYPSHPQDRSPIFLQFLDCVQQLLWQFPRAFEFGQDYLLCIADHLNTAWFGTFLCNCDKERQDLSLYGTTLSLWAYISAQNFSNPDYSPTTEPIFPTINLRRLRLWEEYFLRYDGTALAQRGRMQGHTTETELEFTATQYLAESQDSWATSTVVWMSDDRTNECCACQQKFSYFRRRHHCRACGRIFCHECSKNKMALSHLGYFSPERVCDECHGKFQFSGTQKTHDTETLTGSHSNS